MSHRGRIDRINPKHADEVWTLQHGGPHNSDTLTAGRIRICPIGPRETTILPGAPRNPPRLSYGIYDGMGLGIRMGWAADIPTAKAIGARWIP